MILPIIAYGNPILRKKAISVKKNDDALETLIKNMWETMYNASGVGLSAPQVGKSIRLFVIDSALFSRFATDMAEKKKLKNFKQVFINPTILETQGEFVINEEGCLSIPYIFEDIERKEKIKIHFFDENFKEHTRFYDGLIARIILHEYDHLKGELFVDKLSSFKKRLLKNKLSAIERGKKKIFYKMLFYKKAKK